MIHIKVMRTSWNKGLTKETNPIMALIAKKNTGKLRSKETKIKISLSRKGKPLSEECKTKISENHKGKNNFFYGKHHSKETKKKLSIALSGENGPWFGKKHTSETKKKMSENCKGEKNPFYGKHHTDDAKRKISFAFKRDKHPNWQGGKSFEEYGFDFNKNLKQNVNKRDNNCCRMCNSSEKLTIHHIDYNKKNNSYRNLVTLCRSCHSKTNFNRIVWKDFFTKMDIPLGHYGRNNTYQSTLPFFNFG